jgi:radical SAM superfamily enzyme YgiQ (UPF0313 family)
MKREILLINPWIYDFAAYDFWIKPIGLLYIASILRENGYAVRVLDCLNPAHPGLTNEPQIKMTQKRAYGHGKFPKQIIPKPPSLKGIPKNYYRYGITPKLFIEDLERYSKPDLILVTSMMTYWYLGVFDVIRLVKSVFPDIPVVLGGNYATLCTEHAKLSKADVIISGKGEMMISDTLKELSGNALLFLPDPNNLDSYPYPAYDLLSFFDQVPILTSRGCPLRCAYCASHLLSDCFIRRDPIKVVDEISYWSKKFNITHFSFYDDALFINPEEMAIPMMEEIIRRGLACEFHCPNGLHLSEITSELSLLMFQAGFKTIRFGFETSNEKRQKTTGGKVTNDHLREAVIHLKRAGYKTQEIGVYLLCGLPAQASCEVRKSIEYVKSCGAKPLLAEYSPIPGTALWQDAVKASSFDLEGDPLFHNNSILPCQWDKMNIQSYRDLKLLARNA